MSIQDDFARIYKKYGAEAIASVLGVPAPTVRRWAGKGKSAGIPKSRYAEISALEQIRRHEGYEEKALREMMSEAQRIGKLPKPSNYNKPRDGEKTTGQEASRKFAGFLNEALLLQIREWLENEPVSRGLPNWLANVQLSALASDGSIYVAAPSRVQVDHAEADDFVVSALESSGLQRTRQQSIDSLVGKLRAKLRDGNRYYIHSAGITTYRYKSEAESRERRSRKRRERRK